MTNREREVLKLIESNPMISQEEIANILEITRSSVAVHISNLMKKGVIVGKGYVLSKEESYICVVGGSNIDIQIFDTAFADESSLPNGSKIADKNNAPVLIVMDYAFGEQAFEAMDELLKPYKDEKGDKHLMNIKSISIMGKAGILEGGKGDIMIPNAHIFEGTADNYPFINALQKDDFKDSGLGVYHGPMISVLGTSLQNKDILRFFNKSSWEVIGLEMEGAHYQKAIQAASKIRNSIAENVELRYAYYASDNPLETGGTLASGGLGHQGVLPTYLITEKILEQIFSQDS
jgi:DNA-binding CsgD family transcriptional regulator